MKEKEEEIKHLEEVLNNNEEIPIPVLEKEHTALTERVKELEIKVDGLKKRNETTIVSISSIFLNIFLFEHHLLILTATETIGVTCYENEI